MSNTLAQTFTRKHKEDINVDLVGTDDPTGMTLEADFAANPGDTPVLTVTPTVSGSSPTWTIRIPLSKAQTTSVLSGDKYAWNLWDTASGSSEALAGGTLYLEKAVGPVA